MVKNPPEDMPQVTPYLFYNNVKAALDWLENAFGLTCRMQIPGPDNAVMHAEITLGNGVIMLGQASKEQGGKSPQDLPAVNQSLYVYVNDVEAHYAHAKAANAPGISEPQDMFWGDKMYNVQDLEGHHWAFAQHTRDIAPEDMQIPEM